MKTPRFSFVRGFTMLEVLVTIIILAFGLLGLAGLQSRVSVAEFESYQRSQALILLQDMVDRINTNGSGIRADIKNGTTLSNYLTTDAAGQAGNCAALTGAALDLCEWGNEIVGAREVSGTSNVGSLLAGQGCVIQGADTYTFTVAVSWQGQMATSAPAVVCGANDSTRRVVYFTTTITNLTAP